MDSVLDVQAVQNFLRLARGAQSKDDFMSRVRQFDQKFIDAYPAPTMAPLPNIPRSNSQSGSNIKAPINQPPKNPFVNAAQEKYRIQKQAQTTNQFKYSQIPQQPQQMPRSKPQFPVNLPHSRSQTNFYRQEDDAFDDFNVNNTYAHDFYNNQEVYRQQMMNRSYSQQPDPKIKNMYSQPYIQQNQFLANYETQQPQYVKYYKKMVPQPNPKSNFSQTPRSNPFKQ